MILLSSKNWKTTTLGEIAEVVGGGTPSTKESSYWEGTIPWITPKDLSNYQSMYINKGERHISKEGLENSSATLLPENSILFSSRAPIGYVAINKIPVTTNQGFKSFIPKEGIDYKFLYYWLLHNKGNIEKQASGSVFAEVSGSTMKSIEISIPDSITDQRSIAALLGSLDDKIELLRAENGTLERMAQAIFKEWFVDFRFPDASGATVDSELGPVPAGWRVGKLGEVLKLPSGFAFKSSTFSSAGKFGLVTITHVQNGFFVRDTKDRISELPKNLPKHCLLSTGDVLISLTGEVGRICIIIGENYVLNQRVSKVEPLNKRDKAYRYFLMKSKEIYDSLQSIAVGAVQQNLSPVKALEIEMIIPDDLTLENFSKATTPMFEKMISNTQEIYNLSGLRDNLLDKIFTK